MSYELMLLADPGPARADLLRVLGEAEDIRRDAAVETRYRLTTSEGEACLNIGSKDPVESVHVEFDAASRAMLRSVVERALELGALLGMRVEDVLWGHEVTAANLPELLAHWEARQRPASPAGAGRPWWRVW